MSGERHVALIGYGLAGRVFHAPLITATEGLTLTTVVTSRSDEVRRDLPHATALARPEDLWAQPDRPDLVVIATPNVTHAPLARTAIDHRVPVVVDKPLAVSATEAEQLVEHAARQHVLLTVFQNRRWDADHLTLGRLLAEGHLGQVLRYESRFERWRPEPKTGVWRATPPEQGGGVLLDLGSHLIDQALTRFGPVTHLHAEIGAADPAHGDDDAFLALTHASGTISHLHMSTRTAAPGPRLRVLGSEAALVVPYLDTQEEQLRAGRRPEPGLEWGVQPPSHRGRLVKGDASVPVLGAAGDWPRFYALLAAALTTGAAPPVDPHDAVETLHVIEAARRQA